MAGFLRRAFDKVTNLFNPHNLLRFIIWVLYGIHIEKLCENEVGSRINVNTILIEEWHFTHRE